MLTYWKNGVMYTVNRITGETVAVLSSFPRK